MEEKPIPLEPVFPGREPLRARLVVVTNNDAIDSLRNHNKVVLAVRNTGLPVIPFLNKITAILFCEGSKFSSHAAIIAREFQKALYKFDKSNWEALEAVDGRTVVIDGGKLLVSPGAEDS